MLIIVLLIQLALIFVTYFAGLMAGYRLGSSAQIQKVALGIAVLSGVALLASLFIPLGGLSLVAQLLFPLSLGAYRGSKFRAQKEQGNTKGGPTDGSGT